MFQLFFLSKKNILFGKRETLTQKL